jgi:cholesterol transport system auxiliary component
LFWTINGGREVSGFMRTAAKLLACAGLVLSLTACALAGIGNSAPPATYDLLAPKVAAARGGPSPVQLVVITPQAVRAIDTDRILVKPSDEQITYYSGAVWSDRLPRLVRARLVQALEASGRFRAVGTEDDSVTSPYSIQTSIHAFELAVNGTPVRARVKLSVKIVDEASGNVLANRQFEADATAASDRISDGVQALTEAFQQVALDIVNWIGRPENRSRVSARS